MQAELQPGEHFAELFEGSIAAWQRNKRAGELGHLLFSFVHGFDNAEFGEGAMLHFPLNQRVRDDAGNAASRSQHRVGQDAHQAG